MSQVKIPEALVLDTCPRCHQALHGPGPIPGIPFSTGWELPTYQVRMAHETVETMCEDCLNSLAKRKLIRQCGSCKRWMLEGYGSNCPRCGKWCCDDCDGAHEYEGD